MPSNSADVVFIRTQDMQLFRYCGLGVDGRYAIDQQSSQHSALALNHRIRQHDVSHQLSGYLVRWLHRFSRRQMRSATMARFGGLASGDSELDTTEPFLPALIPVYTVYSTKARLLCSPASAARSWCSTAFEARCRLTHRLKPAEKKQNTKDSTPHIREWTDFGIHVKSLPSAAF